MQINKEYRYHILYRTVNIINSKFYIGVHSSNDKKDKYIGSGVALKRAIKKYGRENFIKENLFFCKNREDLKELEELVVDEVLINSNICYNMTKGGELPPIMTGKDNPMFGKPKSEETKRKIRESLSGDNNPNWGKEGPNKGIKLSEEWKKKISEAGMGRKHSPESILKIKDSRKGFRHTEESKKKLSKAHMGKTLTEKHRRNIGIAVSIALKGKKKTESHKEALRISTINKGWIGGKNPNSKAAQHIKTGIFFPSLKDGCDCFGIKYNLERNRICKNKNFNFKYI